MCFSLFFFLLLNLGTFFLQNAGNTLLSLWFLLTFKVCPLFFPYRFYASVISKLLKYYIGSEATKFRTRLHISWVKWPETLRENLTNSRKISLRYRQKIFHVLKKDIAYCHSNLIHYFSVAVVNSGWIWSISYYEEIHSCLDTSDTK